MNLNIQSPTFDISSLDRHATSDTCYCLGFVDVDVDNRTRGQRGRCPLSWGPGAPRPSALSPGKANTVAAYLRITSPVTAAYHAYISGKHRSLSSAFTPVGEKGARLLYSYFASFYFTALHFLHFNKIKTVE